MPQPSIVILAAGKGERMVSKQPKVMHKVLGKPMVGYVIERAKELSPDKVSLVVGHGREKIEHYVKGYDVLCAVQGEQKGTAHALLSAQHLAKGDDVLVLYGDVPLIRESTLRDFLAFYRSFGSIAFMTTDVDNPTGYGRVVMKGNAIEEIVEQADASPDIREIRRINTGICIIPGPYFPLLKEIEAVNKKGEYYLTDICRIAKAKGLTVRGFYHADASEVLGINSRRDLMEANRILKERVLDLHMRNGVTILDTSIYIETGVTIGMDSIISPNCHISGQTRIGEGVLIGPNSIIKDSTIHNNVTIEGFVVMEGAEIDEGARVGPFSRIRPTTHLGRGAKIGNFVEVKNSGLGEGAKANHLAYIGDAEIGRGVNVGAGTITCNYDGRKKSKTIIEEDAFIGSNTELVAPVRVGKGAIIGAGTTVTKDVPEDALVVSRVPQKHIQGYGRRKRCAE
jgi:bifunctional UDP-N-acetylglucosamine pyrophosphorylase / glucosamine-1-phosphate N-acetyltransferase